jgi:hypothetical protein
LPGTEKNGGLPASGRGMSYISDGVDVLMDARIVNRHFNYRQ